MVLLDAESTFVKSGGIRESIDRLGMVPDPNEGHFTRTLIQAIADGIATSKRNTAPFSVKIRANGPAAVRGDGQSLVEMLPKKRIPSEGRRAADRRKQASRHQVPEVPGPPVVLKAGPAFPGGPVTSC